MEDLLAQLNIFGIEGAELYILGGLILVIGLFIIALLLTITKIITRKLYRRLTSFKQVVLLVTVPKYDVVEQGNKTQGPKTQQELAEKIAKMESFFANIAGLRAQRGTKTEFFGRTDQFIFMLLHQLV
jgi:hypothetical protein